MIKRYTYRGFTDEGSLIETLRVTFLGIPIYSYQCIDALITEQATASNPGIGFTEEDIVEEKEDNNK